jgi:predicted O-methyltransferase YrrM
MKDNMKNILHNIGLSDNTASMTPIQVEQIGTILPEQKDINILEFGSGKATSLIFSALKNKYNKINYVTYETNYQYAPTNNEIIVRMHTNEELINKLIHIPENEIYDIVIIDGPDGEIRKYWYSLFTKNIKSGSIIHIDDAFHFEEFESEFKKYIPNTTYIFEQGRGLNINKCWITAKVI